VATPLFFFDIIEGVCDTPLHGEGGKLGLLGLGGAKGTNRGNTNDGL